MASRMLHRFLAATERPVDPLDRRLAVWCILAGLLLFLVLAGSFFAGGVFAFGEASAPIRVFHAEEFVGHNVSDWQPGARSGIYLTSEGQAGVYHPLLRLLHGCLPLHAALAWERLCAYPLMMLGAWLWLRRLLNRNDAAMLGAMLFAFSGFNLLHFTHPSAVAVVAHIPWLLWAIDIVLVDSRRLPVTLASAAIALLTGSQLLLGSPQFIWLSLLAECCYTVYLLHTRRYTPRTGCKFHATCDDCVGCAAQTWPRVVIAKEIGLLLGGIQVLPALDAWLRGSPATAEATFATWGALHPLNVLQLLAPYLFLGRVIGDNAHEFGLYIGAVPLVLAVWVVIRRHDLGLLGPLALASFAFAIVALLLAFGVYGGLQWIVSLVPILRNFLWPSRAIVLFQLAAAVLAAIGFVLLTREYNRVRQLRSQSPQPIVRDWSSLWRDFEPLWCVVGLSVVISLLGLGLHFEPHIAPIPAIMTGPLLFVAAALLLIAAARGHAAALVGLILLAAVDLGWYGMSSPIFSKINGFCYSYKNDPDAVMLAETPFQSPASKQGSVAVTAHRPGYWEVDLNGSVPQLLVLNEPYRTGWRAAVDGLPREIYRVNGDSMGCTAMPGKHKVAFHYQPESLQRGRFASYLGMGLLSLCFLGCVIHRKPVPWQNDIQ